MGQVNPTLPRSTSFQPFRPPFLRPAPGRFDFNPTACSVPSPQPAVYSEAHVLTPPSTSSFLRFTRPIRSLHSSTTTNTPTTSSDSDILRAAAILDLTNMITSNHDDAKQLVNVLREAI